VKWKPSPSRLGVSVSPRMMFRRKRCPLAWAHSGREEGSCLWPEQASPVGRCWVPLSPSRQAARHPDTLLPCSGCWCGRRHCCGGWGMSRKEQDCQLVLSKPASPAMLRGSGLKNPDFGLKTVR